MTTIRSLTAVCLLLAFQGCTPAKTTTDYANVSHKAEWSHHYAFGSPSWDSFIRMPGNPVVTGRKDMEWPVNGFFFSDPVSKNWYLYIGEYRQNYQSDQDTSTEDFNCVIYRSADRGASWSKVGNLFPPNMPAYDSLHIQVPDVMVVYQNGRYHMIFDWVSDRFDFGNAQVSGLGYASSASPEGPFTISAKPVKVNTEFVDHPLLNRYWRMYAPMLVRRKSDWALLCMMDTSPARSWALAVSTAPTPDGPFENTKIVLSPELKTSYDPLMEYFPAFAHGGYIYLPSTSVSLNRNYQSVYRVRTEAVMDPSRYELYTGGSFWHPEQVGNEYWGIWGQTVSGFVDVDDSLYVMFPSKDARDYGTINLAKASWSHFDKAAGFRLGANSANSFSYLKKMIDVKAFDLSFIAKGRLHIIWDFHSPIDILDGWGKFSLEESNARYKELIIDSANWSLRLWDAAGRGLGIDSGRISKANDPNTKMALARQNDLWTLTINGTRCWTGTLESAPGLVGIALDSHSDVTMNQFAVTGATVPGKITYGFYEALVGAGNQDSSWTFVQESQFHLGKGAISKSDSVFAKWNFEGTGFELYLPKGPQFGQINVYLDGKQLNTLSLKASSPKASAPVLQRSGLHRGKHALFIESTDGLLPVDCIQVAF